MFVSPFYCLQSKHSSSSAPRVVARIRCGRVSAPGSYWLPLARWMPKSTPVFWDQSGFGKHL